MSCARTPASFLGRDRKSSSSKARKKNELTSEGVSQERVLGLLLIPGPREEAFLIGARVGLPVQVGSGSAAPRVGPCGGAAAAGIRSRTYCQCVDSKLSLLHASV